ncbi:hypothetical protein EIL87_02385 [Saccharopolyspora rhizosphaerae]|uniref:DUF485 domain-containing protein n=1 Tax=Saccharopolyspora rhizosphaerae TaxID=2492662 RepID=A0A426K5S1_9PSEU|nr:hypothetical protein [Saccharopolyspora rhizosphaerae]RRO20724.1 hypothetical protein EIL87_02385 [Saccharopolyspora rhizosphaerae]
MSGGPKRVAVTSPQTRVAHARRMLRRRWRAPRLEPEEALRTQALYRAQRRIGAVTLGALFALILGLPLIFALAPDLDGVRVLDVPVSWALLVLLPYPAMAVLARWQLRRAERAEER